MGKKKARHGQTGGLVARSLALAVAMAVDD